MSDSSGKRKGGLLDMFVDVDKLQGAKGDSSPAAPASRSSAPAPAPSAPAVDTSTVEVLSLLGGQPLRSAAPRPSSKKVAAPNTSVNSNRVAQMIQRIQEQVPADNAVVRLMAADKSLASAIPDATARHAAALGVLKGTQGVTDQMLAKDAAAIEQVVESYLGGLAEALGPVKEQEVDARRQRAREARTLVEKLEEQVRELNAEAEDNDSTAYAKEQEIKVMESEFDVVRTAVRSNYNI